MFLLLFESLCCGFSICSTFCLKDEIASVYTSEKTAVILLLLLLLKILCCFVVVVCCCIHIVWLVTGTFAGKGRIIVFVLVVGS